MREFSLHVVDAAGKLSEQRVVAVDEQSAREIVIGSGGTVIRVSNSKASINSFLSRRSHFDLTLFAHELTTLLQAGLSLVEALETLAQRETRRQSSGNDPRILPQLLSSIRQGLPFSTALSQLPQEFPELFVATVAATEQTGDLAVGLQRYLRHDEQVSTLRGKIVSAAVYPALLLIVGSAVGLFLLIYLVPRFSGIYANIDSDVPLASRLLMEWGGFVAAHLVWVVSGLFASLAMLAWWLSQPATRVRLWQQLESLGYVGERIRLVRLSRFFRAMSLLLRGGIPVPRALSVTAPLLTATAAQAIADVQRGVSEGRPLSECLDDAGLSTEVSSRLIRAGERNGQLADMLERVAHFHDEEVSRWLERFMKLFEPILMAVMGLIIGGIVVLLYLPIFEIAGSLQ